jgi:hypothetical protein
MKINGKQFIFVCYGFFLKFSKAFLSFLQEMVLVFDLEFSCEAFFKAFSSGCFCHKQKS